MSCVAKAGGQRPTFAKSENRAIICLAGKAGRRRQASCPPLAETAEFAPAPKFFKLIIPGIDLLLPGPKTGLSSALKRLTAVFGMGTGVAASQETPRIISSNLARDKGMPVRPVCRQAGLGGGSDPPKAGRYCPVARATRTVPSKFCR